MSVDPNDNGWMPIAAGTAGTGQEAPRSAEERLSDFRSLLHALSKNAPHTVDWAYWMDAAVCSLLRAEIARCTAETEWRAKR